jgi:hypothetical protein
LGIRKLKTWSLFQKSGSAMTSGTVFSMTSVNLKDCIQKVQEESSRDSMGRKIDVPKIPMDLIS